MCPKHSVTICMHGSVRVSHIVGVSYLLLSTRSPRGATGNMIRGSEIEKAFEHVMFSLCMPEYTSTHHYDHGREGGHVVLILVISPFHTHQSSRLPSRNQSGL